MLAILYMTNTAHPQDSESNRLQDLATELTQVKAERDALKQHNQDLLVAIARKTTGDVTIAKKEIADVTAVTLVGGKVKLFEEVCPVTDHIEAKYEEIKKTFKAIWKCVCPRTSSAPMYSSFDELELRTEACIQNDPARLDSEEKAAVSSIMSSYGRERGITYAENDLTTALLYKSCDQTKHAIVTLGAQAQPSAASWQRFFSNTGGPFLFTNPESLTVNRTPMSLVTLDVKLSPIREVSNIIQLSDYHRRINIIVVLKNRGDNLKRFARNLAEKCKISPDFNTILSVFDWMSDDIDVNATLRESGLRYNLIQRQGPFSKVRGLHALIDSSKNSDVIFIADVDYHIPAEILSGMLKYVKRGHSVYMPIPWMVQGSDVDCNKCCPSKPNNCTADDYVDSFKQEEYMQMESQLGWATGGFGPIAFYKDDFVGFDGLNIETFGVKKDYEDTDLGFRFFSCNLLVIRGPIYNFVHLPHMFGWTGVS